MRKLYTILSLALMCTLLFSCNKKVQLDEPFSLMILPIYHGSKLSKESLNQASLHFHHNTRDQKVKDFARAKDVNAQKGVLTSSDIATLSAVEGVKNYTLKIPGYQDLELIVDYKHISEKEAQEEQCYCDKPQVKVATANGERLSVESTNKKGENVYYVYLER